MLQLNERKTRITAGQEGNEKVFLMKAFFAPLKNSDPNQVGQFENAVPSDPSKASYKNLIPTGEFV